MAYTMEEQCRVWLSQADMGSRRMCRLLEVYGSARAVWEAFSPAMEKALGESTCRLLGQHHAGEAVGRLLTAMEGLGVQALFPGDGKYPPLLETILCPPPVLYALGDPSVLHGRVMALVGTRTPSRYGFEAAFSLGRELGRQGVTVVSGFARGIDTAAHLGCLQCGGKTAAVLGCGLDVTYPPENGEMREKILEAGGLLLSEYPLGGKPAGYHFPDRNRVLSGVSHGVALLEGKVKSGGMITVGHALDQGREVFALPGPVNREGAEGPHRLLREGARAITCAQDILEDMGWEDSAALRMPGAPVPDIPGAEQVRALLNREDMTFEELVEALSMEASKLNSLLTILELAGIIKKSAGNLYSLAE